MVTEILELAGVKNPSGKIWCNALPPGAMSIKELESLMFSLDMELFLDDFQTLLSIEKTDTGYTLTTHYQRVKVALAYESQGIGPQRPIFTWGEPIINDNDEGMVGSNERLKNLISSGELFDLLGSGDMVKSIHYTLDGYLIKTLKGQTHRVDL